MSTSRFISTLFTVVAFMHLPIVARAAIIPAAVVNVDFGVTSFPGGGAAHSPTYSGVAAGPATAGNFWNELAYEAKQGGVGTFGPTGSLLASDGTTATSITSKLTNENFYYTEENKLSSTGSANGSLLDDYAFGANAISLTIGGLTAGNTYDLYVYSQNGNYKSSVTTFSITGVGSAIANNGTVPTAAGNRGDFTLNGNYVVFTGLTGFTSVNVGTSGVSPPLNGFQLVQTSAVPEPSSAIVFVVAAIPLLRRRTSVRDA